MSFSEGVNGFKAKPAILLCGDIVLAHDEWESLEAVAELRVRWSRLGKRL